MTIRPIESIAALAGLYQPLGEMIVLIVVMHRKFNTFFTSALVNPLHPEEKV